LLRRDGASVGGGGRAFSYTYRARMDGRFFARGWQLSASKTASLYELHSRFEGRVIEKLMWRNSPIKLFFNRHLTNKPKCCTKLTYTFSNKSLKQNKKR